MSHLLWATRAVQFRVILVHVMSKTRLGIATLHSSVKAASVRIEARRRIICPGHPDDLRLLMFHGPISRIFLATDPLITTLRQGPWA